MTIGKTGKNSSSISTSEVFARMDEELPAINQREHIRLEKLNKNFLAFLLQYFVDFAFAHILHNS